MRRTSRPNCSTAPSSSLPPANWCRWRCGPSIAAARWRSPGIYLSDIPALTTSDLFQERVLRSVTANTRADGEEFLRLAERLGVRATIVRYAMADADAALRDLAAGAFGGAAVLHVPAAGLGQRGMPGNGSAA